MTTHEADNSKGMEPANQLFRYEAPFEYFFSFMPMGANIFDAEGKVIAVNSVARSYFGVSEDDPLTNYCLFDDPSITDDTKYKLRHGQPAMEERWIDFHAIRQHKMYVTTRTDNCQTFIQLRYSPYGPNLNSPLGYVVTIQDMTERKQAENALQESENRFMQLAAQSRVVTWEVDARGLYTYVSSVSENVWGYHPNELIGAIHFYDLHPEDGREAFKAAALAVFARKELFKNLINVIKSRDGRTVWVSTNGIPVLDTDGTLQGYRGSDTDITDRKQAEEALQQSEEKYRTLFNTLSPGVVYENASGEIISANPAAEKILGLTLDQMQGRTSIDPRWKAIHEDGSDFPGETHPITVALKTGKEVKDVVQGIYHPEKGCHVWIKIIATPLFQPGEKKPCQAYAIFEDITEQRIAEDNYRMLFQEMLNGFALHEIILDSEGKSADYRFIVVNPAFERMTGLKSEDIAGKTVLDVLPGTERYWIETYGKVAITGEPIRFENYSAALKKHFEITAFRPAQNQFACLISDITDRKLAEEKIREKDIQFRKLSANVPDLIFQFTRKPDGAYCVPIASEGIKNIFGCSPEDVREDFTPIGRVIYPEDAARVIEDIEYSAKHLTYFTCEFRVQVPGREIQWIYSRSAPEKLPDGSITWYGFNTDITEKKKAEEEHLKYEKQLQLNSKLESLGVLAGGIAHDFNNLMGGIYGFIDMASEASSEDNVTRYLSKAMNTIDRARALTLQLLTFAKGGAPVQKIDNLFPFVEETVKFALSGANVSCHFNIPQDLWVCNFDKNQIGQVIDNLIINAQQAMPVGGTIELTTRNVTLAENEHPLLGKGNYVKLTVKDTGVGIPKELITRIFDPFFTTKTKGHGLGLATCYSIINRHGGCIDVDSEPGKGSSFHVYLPASSESVLSALNTSTKTHRGSGTILVMDDEEVMRETIRDMLEALGYSVVCNENGKDAVDFFIAERKENRSFAGLIFDLTVPGGMGGKAAIEEIRKLNENVPAFVASGYADDPVMKNPAEHGFTASICKPFRKSELSEMLNKYMRPKK